MSFDHITNKITNRPGRVPFLGAVVAWTLVWAVYGIQDLRSQTFIGRGEAGRTIDPHEILEALFVVGYSGVRWAAGMVVLVAGAMAVRSGLRKLSRVRG